MAGHISFTSSVLARRGFILIALASCAASAAADDFGTVFDEDFAGIALTLGEPYEVSGTRPSAASKSAPANDFALSAEDLALVLTVTDPVGSRERVAQDRPQRPTFRQRFLDWVTKRERADDSGVLSGLVRDADEPGVHVGIGTEEVRVEYRVGF
ncbi:MAG: hypothetical protein ACR2QV_03125 [Gammaproteobacteria bacterium]